MSKTPYLHIYAQTFYHDHAFLVGNRESLELLRDAIDSALAEGEGKATAYVSDGEGFDVQVYKEEEESYWNDALLPYTDEKACDNREDAIGPWQLFKQHKSK